MSILMLALIAGAYFQETPSEPGPDDVVVTARRNNKCELRLADKLLSDSEFRERAKAWAAGTPARVFLRNEASVHCRLKIVEQLAKWNVRMVEFVDPAGRPAPYERPAPLSTTAATGSSDRLPGPLVSPDGGSIEMSSIKLRIIAGQAAHMIAKGDCTGAMKLVLEAGDLESASRVATICRAR